MSQAVWKHHPAVDEIKKLHGYKYYLGVDVFSAYWSIPVCEESKRLTAFHTPDGIYCWNRLMRHASWIHRAIACLTVRES